MSTLIERILSAQTRHVLVSRLDDNKTPGWNGMQVRYCYPQCESVSHEDTRIKIDLSASDHLQCRRLGANYGNLKTKLYYNPDADGIHLPRFDKEERMESIARVGGQLANHLMGIYLIGMFFNLLIPPERGNREGYLTYGQSMYGFGIPINEKEIIEEVKRNPQVMIELFRRVFPNCDLTEGRLQLDTTRTYWGPLEPEPTPLPEAPVEQIKRPRRFGWFRRMTGS